MKENKAYIAVSK